MRKVPSLKFLVDESVEYRIVEFLRNNNFDTLAAAEDFPSAPDTQVLSISDREERILITNDKDFGELVFKEKQGSKGVILIRMPFSSIEEKILKLDQALKSRAHKLPKSFTVITEKQTRSKSLPKN